MRFLKVLTAGFAIVLAGCPNLLGQTGNGDNVAATWHFAGSTDLAGKPNFDNVKKILSLKTSAAFQDLVLNRFSGWLGESLFSTTNEARDSLLRPLLDDLLSAESIWALGGKPDGPLNFMVALRLDDKRSKTWPVVLDKAIGTPGKSFEAQDFAGEQWNLAGGHTLWMIHAKDWLLVGSPGDRSGELSHYLQQVSPYLQQVRQNGRPAPALKESWLEADIDWPRLAHWLPDFPRTLQLARTKISFTTQGQSILMNAKVTYPKPMPWKFEAWRIPTNTIHDPLISFTAGQDIAAYMDPDEPLAKLTDNPLAGQFYVWSLGEQMPFLTYGAWPVANPTNSLQRIATEAPAALNPALKEMNAGELHWQRERKTLIWGSLSNMLVPTLQVAPGSNSQYLVAALFPLIPGTKPAPDELYQQILGRTNLVYYDWEGTGRRLGPWRALSAMLPVLPQVTIPATFHTTNSISTNDLAARNYVTSLVTEENWLSGITPMLLEDSTITIITRTAPAELTVVRQSPFVMTSLELVLLSHWLSGTGPSINTGLLPPKAKVTGPGIKPNTP